MEGLGEDLASSPVDARDERAAHSRIERTAGEHLERGDTDQGTTEGLGESDRRGDTDAQPREESRAAVNDHSVDVARAQLDLFEQGRLSGAECSSEQHDVAAREDRGQRLAGRDRVVLRRAVSPPTQFVTTNVLRMRRSARITSTTLGPPRRAAAGWYVAMPCPPPRVTIRPCVMPIPCSKPNTDLAAVLPRASTSGDRTT